MWNQVEEAEHVHKHAYAADGKHGEQAACATLASATLILFNSWTEQEALPNLAYRYQTLPCVVQTCVC